MEKPIEIIEYKGYEINIHQDQYAESPNNWANDDIFLIYDHREFNVQYDGFKVLDVYNYLEAKHYYNNANETLKRAKNNLRSNKLLGNKSEIKYYKEVLTRAREVKKEWIDELNNYDDYSNKYEIFPLYAYIHSGVSLSLSKTGYPFTCRFDTSMEGFIFVKKDVKWVHPLNEVAQSLVDSWNNCLSGNVYGFVITKDNYCKCCKNNSIDEIDSCWGFYGNYNENGMVDECKAIIDNVIRAEAKKEALRIEKIYGKQLEIQF